MNSLKSALLPYLPYLVRVGVIGLAFTLGWVAYGIATWLSSVMATCGS
ncbi:hypothetical protein [Streptomyces europaeiscabiei]